MNPCAGHTNRTGKCLPILEETGIYLVNKHSATQKEKTENYHHLVTHKKCIPFNNSIKQMSK